MVFNQAQNKICRNEQRKLHTNSSQAAPKISVHNNNRYEIDTHDAKKKKNHLQRPGIKVGTIYNKVSLSR